MDNFCIKSKSVLSPVQSVNEYTHTHKTQRGVNRRELGPMVTQLVISRRQPSGEEARAERRH